MGKLSEILKNLTEKWNSKSNGVKIAFGVLFLGIIAAIIYGVVATTSTKYSVLFSNLDNNDAQAMVAKLKEKKITAKYSGSTIMVPSDMVDELRLELQPDIQNGSKGFELFDGGNQLVSTDTETRIKYQRALQGELEKTIKGFPQIDMARVSLVLPEDSVFVKDATPASASVTLKMKSGQSLKSDQVKAIVSLISGSVKNLPKENIQVVDDKMTLLTKGLFDQDNVDLTDSADKQQQMKKDYEKYLEDKVMSMLGKAFKDKVSVKINADLDFDAGQKTSVTVDPKGTIVSEKRITDTNGNGTTTVSQSPLDNNMVNSTTTNNTVTGNIVHDDRTTNYEISKTEEKTIKAAGSVKRITASVIVDGKLDQMETNSLKNTVSTAIGIDEKRGDAISVEGIAFDNTDADKVKKDLEEMNKLKDQESKTKLYTYIGIGAGSFILLLILIIALRRKKKPSEEQSEFEEMTMPKGIDVVIGDNSINNHVNFKPIDFDDAEKSEKHHVEKEIKRYATEKPDQVADIIKSWLAEDER